jgi:hypothetical protein
MPVARLASNRRRHFRSALITGGHAIIDDRRDAPCITTGKRNPPPRVEYVAALPRPCLRLVDSMAGRDPCESDIPVNVHPATG